MTAPMRGAATALLVALVAAVAPAASSAMPVFDAAPPVSAPTHSTLGLHSPAALPTPCPPGQPGAPNCAPPGNNPNPPGNGPNPNPPGNGTHPTPPDQGTTPNPNHVVAPNPNHVVAPNPPSEPDNPPTHHPHPPDNNNGPSPNNQQRPSGNPPYHGPSGDNNGSDHNHGDDHGDNNHDNTNHGDNCRKNDNKDNCNNNNDHCRRHDNNDNCNNDNNDHCRRHDNNDNCNNDNGDEVTDRTVIKLGGCGKYSKARGRAVYEQHSEDKDVFRVTVHDLALPDNTELIVRVDGKKAGTFELDDQGDGKLTRRSDDLPDFLKLQGDEKVTISDDDKVVMSKACLRDKRDD